MASGNVGPDEVEEKDNLIFVNLDDANQNVKDMVEAGRIILKPGTVAIGAESSPNGLRLEAPFATISLRDADDSEAVLTMFQGLMAKLLAYAIGTFNTRRKLQARLDLIDANRGPEYAFIKQARSFVKMESEGQKIPKKFRGLDENKIAKLLYDDANENE